jgi:hypothetical protein
VEPTQDTYRLQVLKAQEPSGSAESELPLKERLKQMTPAQIEDLAKSLL